MRLQKKKLYRTIFLSVTSKLFGVKCLRQRRICHKYSIQGHGKENVFDDEFNLKIESFFNVLFSFSRILMSTSVSKIDSLQTKSDHEHVPVIIQSPEIIRQRVEDRHWQLFEARLKKQSTEINKENYTTPNDYRIINRLKKIDQPQPPIEPNRRWETFCTQVTDKSNESNRVMSIFHNVWQKNWNTKQINDTQKRRMTDPTANDTAFLTHVSTNEHDRKVISSILHRTTSSDDVPSDREKKKAT
jgi:hypothetical protein